MLAMVASMSRRRASSVAQAMCGVIRQLGAVEQRVVGPDRLDGDHVHGGAGQPARGQRLGQVRLDDQRPARRVDQERGRLQPVEPIAVDQAGGLRRQRASAG